jgi:hypothetical protein
MTTRHLRTLVIVLVVLLVGLFATKLSNNQSDISTGGLLLPDLKAQINDISQVTITRAGDSVTIRKESGKWALRERRCEKNRGKDIESGDVHSTRC